MPIATVFLTALYGSGNP